MFSCSTQSLLARLLIRPYPRQPRLGAGCRPWATPAGAGLPARGAFRTDRPEEDPARCHSSVHTLSPPPPPTGRLSSHPGDGPEPSAMSLLDTILLGVVVFAAVYQISVWACVALFA